MTLIQHMALSMRCPFLRGQNRLSLPISRTMTEHSETQRPQSIRTLLALERSPDTEVTSVLRFKFSCCVISDGGAATSRRRPHDLSSMFSVGVFRMLYI